jgi:alpha-tubulin suppressor-like RCC1 family protein
MFRVYFSLFCLGLIGMAGCNKVPPYTPDSGNTTQLYGFGLEKTVSNPNLNRYYEGMIMGDTAVHLTVDYGTDISSLEPTVIAYADSIFPRGKQNFTSPVSYTIWANGKSATYIVRMKVSTIQNPTVQAIAAGPSHVLALKTDGTLWASGDNSHGQLGTGDYSSRNTMTQVPVYDVARFYTGECGTVIFLKDGTAWATGNDFGQLGIGNTNAVVSFTREPYFDDAVQIAITFGEILVLKPDGTLWGAGNNLYRVLGQGDYAARSSFVKIPVSNVKQISSYAWDVMAVTTSGELWGWGYNFMGELGLGDSAIRATPVKIPFSGSIARVYSGASNSFLVDNGGQVWAVGLNNSGQLGFGNQAAYHAFTPVPFFTGKSVANICSATGYTLFQDGAGSVWGVGGNFYGQLGQGNISTLPVLNPVQVNGITAKSICGQGGVAFALKTDATLWGWGINLSGVLTISPDSVYSTTPVQVLK